jgi:hypothetical protein
MFFRKKHINLELALDIKMNRTSNFLIVEKEKDHLFVLVEGYRRYFALEYLKEKLFHVF